jgi:hypothetical protein
MTAGYNISYENTRALYIIGALSHLFSTHIESVTDAEILAHDIELLIRPSGDENVDIYNDLTLVDASGTGGLIPSLLTHSGAQVTELVTASKKFVLDQQYIGAETYLHDTFVANLKDTSGYPTALYDIAGLATYVSTDVESTITAGSGGYFLFSIQQWKILQSMLGLIASYSGKVYASWKKISGKYAVTALNNQVTAVLNGVIAVTSALTTASRDIQNIIDSLTASDFVTSAQLTTFKTDMAGVATAVSSLNGNINAIYYGTATSLVGV